MNVFKLTLIHPSTTRFDTTHCTALHSTAQRLLFVDAQAYRWKSQMNELLNTHNAMQNAWIYLLCSIWYSKLKCAFIIMYGMHTYTHIWQVQPRPDPINILDGTFYIYMDWNKCTHITHTLILTRPPLLPHALDCLFYNLTRTLLPLGKYMFVTTQSSHCRHPHSFDSHI